MTIPTLARTRTDASHTAVQVWAVEGRVRVRTRADAGADAPVIRPVLVSSDAVSARVCLVPEGALLLAGDAIELDVVVGPGVLLELVEPGGTVAYDMRGGGARWDVSVHLEAGARLVWHGEPFVVASGACVDRSTSVVMDEGALLAVRETLVLGRHGEAGGRLRQRCTVQSPDGIPVLVEDLELDSAATGPLLGGSRTMGSVLQLGTVPDPAPDTLLLEAGGGLTRRFGDHAHEVQPEGPWLGVVRAVRF